MLDYNPETGNFTWKKNGKVAGSVTDKGYITVRIKDYGLMKAHRLAWLYVFGNLPPMIDHKNRLKHDNRISNLREATKSLNGANRGLNSNSSSGIKGVSWYKTRNLWMASICVNGVSKTLGYFNTKEEAAATYKETATKVFGEFA